MKLHVFFKGATTCFDGASLAYIQIQI